MVKIAIIKLSYERKKSSENDQNTFGIRNTCQNEKNDNDKQPTDVLMLMRDKKRVQRRERETLNTI